MQNSNAPQPKTSELDRAVVQEGWVIPKKLPVKNSLEPEPRVKPPHERPDLKVTLDEGWDKAR